jgi:hypothetical protein
VTEEFSRPAGDRLPPALLFVQLSRRPKHLRSRYRGGKQGRGDERRGVDLAAQAGCGLAPAVASAANTGASTTGSCQAAATASPIIVTARTRSEPIMTSRRSNRSLSMPPIGPSSTMETTHAAVVALTQVAECVRS